MGTAISGWTGTSNSAGVTVVARPTGDGSSWSVVDISGVTAGRISFANQYFFTRGGRSSDGSSWINIAGNPLVLKGHVFYGNGIYFDGRNKSTDGRFWSAAPYPNLAINNTNTIVAGLNKDYPPSLAFGLGGGPGPGLGKFMGVYKSIPDRNGNVVSFVLSTLDGINYTQELLSGPPASGLDTFLLSSGGSLWIGATGGNLVYSTNSTVWATATGDFTLGTSLDALTPRFAYNATPTEKFIAVIPGLFVWTSVNGVEWTKRVLPTSGNWCGVAFQNGVWMLVSEGSTTCVTSPDGITWTSKDTLPSPPVELAAGNGKFIAATQTRPNFLISG